MDEKVTEQLLDYVRNRYFGKYRGTVTDTNDTTKRGRVKVKVPAVLGGLETWAMPCFPYAGNGVGLFAIPEKESGVWVEFEGGDPSYPIYTGGFWGDNEVPVNEQDTPAVPTMKILRSEKGLQLSMNDEGQIITLSDQDGSNIMTIEVQAGTIKVKGKTKVIVEAPSIELVEEADHPIVFGDELKTYFQNIKSWCENHIHLGESAAGPVTIKPPLPPPFPAFPASINSTKVKAG